MAGNKNFYLPFEGIDEKVIKKHTPKTQTYKKHVYQEC